MNCVCARNGDVYYIYILCARFNKVDFVVQLVEIIYSMMNDTRDQHHDDW